MIDVSKGIELGKLRSGDALRHESGRWHCMWLCEKWSEDACDWIRKQLGLPANAPISSALLRTLIPHPDIGMEVVDGNVLTNAGIQRMEDNLISVPASTAVLDNTHSRIGVSDTTGTATAADTALFGGTNRQWKLQNATFPSRSSQTVTWQADFASGEANWHWQDSAIDNGTASGTGAATAPMLNHKAEDLGTKATGTWTLSGAVTIS